ncbi:uncharacterized protein LOC144487166 isoform X4 [Mustelus asterias]
MFLIILLALLHSGLCADPVTQSPVTITASEGDSVQLDCNYTDKEQNALKPSIYILPPRESDRKASPVCLVTDYFPNNVSMSVSAGGQTSNRSHEGASLSLADRTYSMVGFLSSSQSTQDGVFNCMCDYGSKRLPQDGQIEPQCIEVEEDEEGDEQANLLSLTVFCLRILFLKSIVFNVLMTIRVWVS